MSYLPSREQPLLDEISELLGGNLFLSTRFFEYPLAQNPSFEYLARLKSAIKLAFLVDSDSELEKDGMLPEILRKEIVKITRARLENPRGNQRQNHVNYGDIRRVIEVLRGMYDDSRDWSESYEVVVEKISLHRFLSLPSTSFSHPFFLLLFLLPFLDTEDEKSSSSEEEDEDDSDVVQDEEETKSSSGSSGSSQSSEEGSQDSQDSNKAPKASDAGGELSESRRSCISVADRITECWGNDSWKKVRLRHDLEPVTLLNRRALTPLLKIANLTRCESSIGFPPLASKVLKEALRRDELTGQSKSSKGWAQEKVIKAALVILEKKVASKKSSKSSSNKSSKANQPAIGSSSTAASSSSKLKPSFASSSFGQTVSSSIRKTKSSSSPTSAFEGFREVVRSKYSKDPSRFDEEEVERHLKVLKDFFES